MPDFDKNAAFIWAIVTLGVALPLLMAIYAGLRLRLAQRRLKRLQETETSA